VVLALADHLGLRRFGILGHSMGGGTALVLAAEHRDRVSAAVLIASVALRLHRGLSRSPGSFRRMGRALEVPLLRQLLLPSVRAAYRKRRFPGAETMDAKTFGLQLRAIGAVDFARFQRAVALGLPKTLVAYACDDPMIEKEISAELVQAIPHARALAFEDGGHNIQKTKAREIAAAIRQLLAPDLDPALPPA
jgi:pimeloyl-ACP methyl ester carboxylesterase